MFSDADKRIFGPYDDGSGGLAWADPVRVQRRLAQLMPGDTAAQLLEDWKADNPDVAVAAAEQFLTAVSEAFEMRRFNRDTGCGATEDVVRAVWDAFQAWLSKKNATGPAGPTPSPSTAIPPASSTTTTPTSGSS